MTSYRAALQGREQIANGTVAFHFEKPVGFSFKSGQAIDVVLADGRTVDVQSGRHTFSIVSAPFESELTIATRMRDSTFKRAFARLPVGSLIQIEGPFGSLTLHNDLARPAVLIAGGIGITPFMSILRQATHDRREQRLVLLYSNRRPEDTAFLSELQNLEERNLNFRLAATMTLMGASVQPWGGQTGMVNEALLKAAVEGQPNPIYYVAGPPALVAGMRQTLHDSGVDDDDIRSEEFYGY